MSSKAPSTLVDGSGARARPGSGAMFDGIAPRYDLMNRLLSLGIDQRWRTRTVAALELEPGERVLDLATGTGDLAIKVARAEPSVSVLGVDPSARMLELAQKKIDELGLAERVSFAQGDAESLPHPERSFDAVCMAFGIRNVPDRPRALREIARVTRRGGRVAILELSEPRGVLGPFARFHVHTLVPWLGALLSGAKEYRYLEQSIAAFPAPEMFVAMLRDAGLRVLSADALSFGACHLYVAEPEVGA